MTATHRATQFQKGHKPAIPGNGVAGVKVCQPRNRGGESRDHRARMTATEDYLSTRTIRRK